MERWEQPDKNAAHPAQGIRSAILPGVFDGLILALEKYGTMSFAQVSAPAAEYADGFPIAEEFAGMLRGYQPILELWPASKAFYYPNGTPPQRARSCVCLRWRTPCVNWRRSRKRRAATVPRSCRPCATFSIRLDRQAHRCFSEANEGLITYDDLKNFHAGQDDPKTAPFHGFDVYKPGFWTQGPVMLEALNILEGYDLKAMGHNSPSICTPWWKP